MGLWSESRPEEYALSSDSNSDPLEEPEDWPRNYFNYFTEIEDHFQRARGTGLFLLSPVDWALIDTWRTAGIPLQAVLKGVDDAFEKWHSRKLKRRMVNSLAYCAQAVLEAAKRTPTKRGSDVDADKPLYEARQIVDHLLKAAKSLRDQAELSLTDVAHKLEVLAAEAPTYLKDLESLEQRLTTLEEKVIAALRASQTDEALLSIRQTLSIELRPYRSKMTADQLATLERRYLDTALLERAHLPRFSLFYLH